MNNLKAHTSNKKHQKSNKIIFKELNFLPNLINEDYKYK